jgi:hypothetical protein
MERFYNENPQVTFWKEEAEKAIVEAKIAQKQARGFLELLEDSNRQVKELIEITGEANEVSNGFSKTIKEYIELMRKFDKLPWWSKMFFKFGI